MASAGEIGANGAGLDTNGAPKARGDEMRLAQLTPETAPPEATTGNPSLAPLKWVGMLVVPAYGQGSQFHFAMHGSIHQTERAAHRGALP
ncbi:MAG TPA: hypothetical protein VEF36_10870 [Roseiarcus sp.]|nr:hypothetical protein [Roseiarcus sp.]